MSEPANMLAGNAPTATAEPDFASWLDGRDPVQALERIVWGIVDSIWEMTDAEIREEMREDGEDPDQVAEQTRQVLMGALQRHRRHQARRHNSPRR